MAPDDKRRPNRYRAVVLTRRPPGLVMISADQRATVVEADSWEGTLMG